MLKDYEIKEVKTELENIERIETLLHRKFRAVATRQLL